MSFLTKLQLSRGHVLRFILFWAIAMWIFILLLAPLNKTPKPIPPRDMCYVWMAKDGKSAMTVIGTDTKMLKRMRRRMQDEPYAQDCSIPIWK